MSIAYLALASVQMLMFGVCGFVALIVLAVWFYRRASGGEDSASLPEVKVPEPRKPHFIPVVVPARPRQSVPEHRPAPKAGGSLTAFDAWTPIPRTHPPRPPSVVTDSSPPLSTAESTQPPASRHFLLVADVRQSDDGMPALHVRCRGLFTDIPKGGMFFEVVFKFADDEAAQLRTCTRLGAGWIPLRLRRMYDEPLGKDEWFELGSISLRDLIGPCSGTHLVQAKCSAYACDPGVELADAMPDSEPLCSVAAGVNIPFIGLGYDDFAVWLVRREKALAIATSCASDEAHLQNAHAEAVRSWIADQCSSLDAHPEIRKTAKSRLLARLDASYFGSGTTFDECDQFARLASKDGLLLDSICDLFSTFGQAEGLGAYAIERICNACLWFGRPCPDTIEQARARLSAGTPPALRAEEPVAVPAKGAPSAGFPFAVSLALIGPAGSATGFRVMVSGDLPVRTSSSDDLCFTVSVSDADERVALPFFVPSADVDGLNEVIKPTLTIARNKYDPSAPRQVAEVIFNECSFPRHGERNIQVSCVGYSVDGAGGLTRLCYGDASGSVRISGTGYVTLRKRRRSLRGLMLELALASGTAGSVTLDQKTIAKDWISLQVAGIADPDERKQTVNYLTKALLSAASMSAAETVALAARLAGYRQAKYSEESVRLARMLAEAKPLTLPRVLPVIEKIRKELGLPPSAAPSRPSPPRPARQVSPPVRLKTKPVRVPRAKLNPRQLRAKALERKLSRTVSGWKDMSSSKKVAYLRSEILGKSARMAGLKGLAERNSLQAQITDMSELVVMIRSVADS